LILAAGVAPILPAQTPLYFGWSSVTPEAADYDGDGTQELCLYDSADGTLYVRLISGEELTFGLTIAGSDYAIAEGDYDGDGKGDLGSYDRVTGACYAFCSRTGYRLSSVQCAPGPATTRPYPADYDGDSKADPALYDSVSGAWIIYPSASDYQPVPFVLGGNGAVAVPMDYDGDNKADPCVYDEANGFWSALCSASRYAYTWVEYGGPGCEAAPADFDGDHKADPTVYCSALGVWGTLNSASNYAPCIKIQGGPNCTPIPGNYYFTNHADYAVYNATNGGWYIDYPLQLSKEKNGSKFLKFLAKGAVSGSASGIVGWTLRRTFDVNNDPSQWSEVVAVITNMNQKLDDLLDSQIAVQNQIAELAAQFQYNMDKTTQLIDGGPAKDACSMICTHYDQIGPDSYRSFYECETNNLPPNGSILNYAANVKGPWDIANQVTRIHDAIMPSATSPGLLWDWAALATNKLSVDNLTDHITALVDYYDNLYAYQMKGATIYADACRVTDTSAWANAQVASYITNTVVSMIRQQTDVFREVGRAYILTALSSSYNPFATNSIPVAITNVNEALSSLEFFSRQWLGQPQSLCATFLAVNPFSNTVSDVRVVDTNAVEHAVQTVTTNWARGRTYGYLPDTRNYVAVDDNYAFLNCDFGRQPCGAYVIKRGVEILGAVTVSNYDDNMQPTSSPSDTNWFGHFHSLPVLQQVTLPLDVSGNNRYDNITYCSGASPDDWVMKDMNWIRYTRVLPTSLTDWHEKFVVEADDGAYLHSAQSRFCGFNPWVSAYCFIPIAVSNNTGRAISVRAQISVASASAFVMRCEKDDKPPKGDFFRNWCWEIYGFAQFDLAGHMAKWAEWKDTKSHRICSGSEYYGRNWPACEAVAYTTIPASGAATRLYVGENLLQVLDIRRLDSPGLHYFTSVGEVECRYKISKIRLSFY